MQQEIPVYANRIRKFWKAVQIGILMHNSWLLRNNAAIEMQRICRGFLGKKLVVTLCDEICTRPEYKNAFVECVGDISN